MPANSRWDLIRRLRVNDLRVQKRNPDVLLIYLKSPGKRTPSRFPKRDPIEREARLQGILHYLSKTSSLGFSSKGALRIASSNIM